MLIFECVMKNISNNSRKLIKEIIRKCFLKIYFLNVFKLLLKRNARELILLNGNARFIITYNSCVGAFPCSFL